MDELDPNHAKAIKLLKSMESDRVVSNLTVVELASVYSRAELEEPLALSIYSVRRINARVIDVDFNKVLLQALRLAPTIKLRTLDLLHVALCKITGIRFFATFDRDVISKSNLIDKEVGIKIVTR
jgi:predicted nucleic acid-binding protein